MRAVLLDTHTFIWSLFLSSELSATARGMIEAADAAYVAPISFYEITQKHRLGKWPELDPVIGKLLPLWRAQGTEIAPCTAEIAFLAGAMQWRHRDPFDRMIAATAIALACPVSLIVMWRVFLSAKWRLGAVEGFGRPWDARRRRPRRDH